MKILVCGGTGMVGSQVVDELLKGDIEVSVLTRRDRDKTKIPGGVNHVKGDLLNPQTARTMCKDMDAMFLINSISTSETHEGLMAINGARMSDVKKIVYLSVHSVDKAPHLPHFGAKIAIETAIKASGISYVILRANNFFQNDYWFKESLMKYGIYPQPIGNTGVSRVDIRDIAEAAAITLTGDRYRHGTFNLVGPEVQTGKSTAEAWSEALGSEIYYGGDNLDAWEEQSLEYMPDWMAFDFKMMYQLFQEEGLKATKNDIRALTALLGHPPRKFEDFTRQTAEMWKKEYAVKR